MRTTVLIQKRGDGYFSTVKGQFGGGHTNARAGLTPYDAAIRAAQLMLEYGQPNPLGATLMAPREVMDEVPSHLQQIDHLPSPS